MADPARSKPSYDTGTVMSVTNGAATPGSTAFTERSAPTPDPTASITSPSGVPSSTSPTSGATTSPVTVHTMVPGDSAVPRDRNHSAPRARIAGTLLRVSTLLTSVGFAARTSRPTGWLLPSQPVVMSVANRPCWYGGNSRGSALRPSITSSRAVSSP